MLMAAFIAVAAFAAGQQERSFTKTLPVMSQFKKAPRGLVHKAMTAKARAPKKAETASIVGDYIWNYLQTGDAPSTDLESLTTTEGSARITITESATTEGGYTISNMFPNSIEATVESEDGSDYLVITPGQTFGTSGYGDYTVYAMIYYEGDETYAAGWYYADIYGLIQEDGSIYFEDWFERVLTSGDYEGYYLNPIWVSGSTLTPADPIADVAAVPASPTDLRVQGYDASAGYGAFLFDLPAVDVDGNDLLAEKLFYQLYSDVEGDIQPITFTPDLYVMLTEDMSIIPYTFTDTYDFESEGTLRIVFMNYEFDTMYNRIGVKSIYTGGDEVNESEIVWFDIKPYETLATFNFNEMDVPVSATGVTDGDITEATTLEEGNVSLTISTSTTSTPNRYWSTTAGPQLRVYGGTLTFSAAEGYVIAKIVFNHNGKWGAGNSADSGEITNDADAKAATWTGSAQTVVVTIAANTQINSIDVILAKDVATQTVVVSEAGYATVVAEQALDFTGLDVQAFTCEAKETYVHLDPITVVPAGTAVVVKAAAGSYDVPVTTEAGAEQYNDLVAAAEAFVADGTQYILADGAEGVGFYKATPETTIAAGKGYIVKASSVKAFYGFDSDDATGISGINVADENAVIYNVAGQRLSKAVKGINIINGKKVLK